MGTKSCDVEVDVGEGSGRVSLACTLTKGTGGCVVEEGESEMSKELRRWEKEDNVILFRLIFLVDTEDGEGEELAIRGLMSLTIASLCVGLICLQPRRDCGSMFSYMGEGRLMSELSRLG